VQSTHARSKSDQVVDLSGTPAGARSCLQVQLHCLLVLQAEAPYAPACWPAGAVWSASVHAPPNGCMRARFLQHMRVLCIHQALECGCIRPGVRLIRHALLRARPLSSRSPGLHARRAPTTSGSPPSQSPGCLGSPAQPPLDAHRLASGAVWTLYREPAVDAAAAAATVAGAAAAAAE